jgi:hypothetical protein
MTRDVRERLEMYSRTMDLEVVRLALNWDQVQQWQPPENPAKETDARFKTYRDEFGESCWELDAVEPAQLADLVREAVMARQDVNIFDEAMEIEDEGRAELADFVKQYNKKKGK